MEGIKQIAVRYCSCIEWETVLPNLPAELSCFSCALIILNLHAERRHFGKYAPDDVLAVSSADVHHHTWKIVPVIETTFTRSSKSEGLITGSTDWILIKIIH